MQCCKKEIKNFTILQRAWCMENIFLGLGILFAIEGWLWHPIKSASKFQLDPLSNQRCLSQA
jgi:hypothetical protein